MPANANQELFDATIRHQVSLLRFSEGEASRLQAILSEAEEELVGRISTALAQGRDVSRMEAVLASVKRRRADVYERAKGSLTEALADLAESEHDWEQSAAAASSPIDLDLASVPPETLRAIAQNPIQGLPLEGWLDSIKSKEALSLDRAVMLAVTEGQTIDDLVRRIAGTQANGFKDGILSVSRREAAALARTAVNHVSNQARENMWAQNEDIVQALRWTSTLDGRTSTICASRDGQLASVNGNDVPPTLGRQISPPNARPPAHFNCRSVMVAVLDGVEMAGDRPFVSDPRTRAEREKAFRREAKERGVPIQQVRKEWADANVGTLPANTDYQSWLSRQSNEFQDDVLGPSKAQLFRDGTPLERFVDGSGKELSLSELRAELGLKNELKSQVKAETSSNIGSIVKSPAAPIAYSHGDHDYARSIYETWDELLPQSEIGQLATFEESVRAEERITRALRDIYTDRGLDRIADVVTEVDLNILSTRQLTVRVDKLTSMVNMPQPKFVQLLSEVNEDGLPVVLLVEGQYIIHDGNHRLTAAYLRKMRKAKVIVREFRKTN